MVLFFPYVSYAIEPSDPYYATDQWYLEKISASEAWNISTGSKDVVIAILDTGLDMNHPDIIENLWVNEGEIPGNGIDDDGNGFVDDVHGWDFIDNNGDPSPDTSEGSSIDAIVHGTIISGIIGAEGDNGIGIAGINWNVSVMPIRMLDKEGSGSSVIAQQAIDYAVQNGADVINMSFTSLTNDALLTGAVERAYKAGVVVVAALGNDDIDTTVTPVYPACLREGEDDWVIGVAASTKNDKKASFSNYGNCVDITAPGVGVFGLSYHDAEVGFEDLYTAGWSGTSVAAPIVAGAAGLLLSVHPSLTPKEIRTILKLSVDPIEINTLYQGKMGSGRLNLARAFEYADSIITLRTADHSSVLEGIQVGDFVRTEQSSTVFIISSADERRAIVDTNTYFTYEDSFKKVKLISPEEIANFRLTGLILPKEETVLVKIQSVPTVYSLGVNSLDAYSPLLRKIEDEGLAIDLYGEHWADYVIDIEATFFTRFGAGSDMTSLDEVQLEKLKTRAELAALAQAQ